jgi:hypothetical protein
VTAYLSIVTSQSVHGLGSCSWFVRLICVSGTGQVAQWSVPSLLYSTFCIAAVEMNQINQNTKALKYALHLNLLFNPQSRS